MSARGTLCSSAGQLTQGLGCRPARSRALSRPYPPNAEQDRHHAGCGFWFWCTPPPASLVQDQELRPIEEQYLLGKQLSHSGPVTIWYAFQRTDKTPVMLKLVRRAQLTSEQEEAVLTEASILGELVHPGIVRLLGFHSRPEQFYMVLELQDGPPLLDAVVQRKGRYSEAEVRQAVGGLVEALAHIHNRGVVHGGICPGCLRTRAEGDLQVKVLGWDTARRIPRSGPQVVEWRGPPVYRAPEVVHGGYGGMPADVYGLGLVLHLLLVGYLPLHNTLDLQEEPWRGTSQQAQDLASAMLEPSPERRITAREALSHPWMTASAADLGRTDRSASVLPALARFRSQALSSAAAAPVPSHGISPISLQIQMGSL